MEDERRKLKMTEQEWNELTDTQKEFLVLYHNATDEMKNFIEWFIMVATEKKEGRDVDETLKIMRERNMATPEMFAHVEKILAMQKAGTI